MHSPISLRIRCRLINLHPQPSRPSICSQASQVYNRMSHKHVHSLFQTCASKMLESWREERQWPDNCVLQTMVTSFLQHCPPHLGLAQDCPKPETQDLEVYSCVTSFTNDVIRIRVRGAPHLGFIVKMAPASPRNLTKDLSLPLERGLTEHNAYIFFNSLVPGCTPTSLFYDHDNRIRNTVCIQELTGHLPLSGAVLSGQFSGQAARALGTTLASLHSATLLTPEGGSKFEHLTQQFPASEAMLTLIRTYHFERPFDPNDTGRRCHESVLRMLPEILDNAAVISAKNEARHSFLNDLECLIHGDLHIESVLINGSDIKFVDTEFARVGSCAFDTGLLLATLLTALYRYRHVLHEQEDSFCTEEHGAAPDQDETDRLYPDTSLVEKRTEAKGGEMGVEKQEERTSYTMDRFPDENSQLQQSPVEDILLKCTLFLEEYTSKMRDHGHLSTQDREKFQRELLQKIATFAGCEILACVIGPPHMSFMDSCPAAQVDCVRTAVRLLTHRHCVSAVPDLVRLLS